MPSFEPMVTRNQPSLPYFLLSPRRMTFWPQSPRHSGGISGSSWKIWLLAPLLASAVTATLAAARLIGAVVRAVRMALAVVAGVVLYVMAPEVAPL